MMSTSSTLSASLRRNSSSLIWRNPDAARPSTPPALDPAAGRGERGDGVRFQRVGSLRGHASDVTSLAVGNGRLYSGARDGSIRAWNVPSMEAVASSSPFGSPRSVGGRKDGRLGLEEVYCHCEHQGVLLNGTADGNGGAVLMCSLSDGTSTVGPSPCCPSLKATGLNSWREFEESHLEQQQQFMVAKADRVSFRMYRLSSSIN
ncbi:unnamed protein product [Spirodela intermedia]|uniref:Uncharacterized protein n=1 Tax=Spirodela intermedia TaxID=51605 RepID=A0ABN7EB01_SPIIN|nr:unnamed protein product [Spirodela intermedia]